MTFNIEETDYKEILKSLSSKFLSLPRLKKSIIDVGCSFDIETTQINTDQYHHAYMYIWMFSINEDVFYGRTWKSFLQFYLDFCKIFHTGELTSEKSKYKNKVIVLVHNLSFEFSFIGQRLPWKLKKTKSGFIPMIFTKDAHNVVTATTVHNIQFVCTSNLTGKNLAKLAKDSKLDNQKLVGDLDYNLIRNSQTELTPQELQYCFNDVLILSEYFNKIYKKLYLKEGVKQPTTKTSIVRNALKKHFKDSLKLNLAEYPEGFPDTKELYNYLMLWVYRGGYTHNNVIYTEHKLEEDISGYDFTSSYPARFFELYPWKFHKLESCSKQELLEYLHNSRYAVICTLRFHNIKSKTSHSLESRHKCINVYDPDYCYGLSVDNGRVAGTIPSNGHDGLMTVALNELDFNNYEKCYQWESFDILGHVYISEKKPLPNYLIDLMCKYYWLKSTIDSIKNPVDYKLAKENLNSIYGMCCSSIFHDDFIWNGTNFQLSESSKEYEEMIKDQILLPQWGVWISAYARNAEVDRMIKLGDDAIYGDTDSWKVRNPEKHRIDMMQYNDYIDHKLMSKDMSKLDFKYIGCSGEQELKSIIKGLGRFTKESEITKFKSLGCKRYIMECREIKKDGTLSDPEVIVKCAGMKSDKFLEKYKDKTVDELFDLFSDGLKLDKEISGKLATCYNSVKHNEIVIDYQGNSEEMGELGSACLFPIPFSMGISNEYRAFLTILKNMKRKY